MKGIKKLLSIILIATMIFTLVAGCGGTDQDSSNAGSDNDASGAEVKTDHRRKD